MGEYVDWQAEQDESTGLAVLLPGRNYPTTMPLLTFAGRAAAQHGWRVRAVSWQAPELDVDATIDWVGSELRDAVGDFSGRVLVVGKSLGTCAAIPRPRFARRSARTPGRCASGCAAPGGSPPEEAHRSGCSGM